MLEGGGRLTRIRPNQGNDTPNLLQHHIPPRHAHRQQRDARKQQREPPDADPVEAARPLNHPPAAHRRAHAKHHARHEQRAADHGAEAVHGLKVQRQEEEGAHLARHAEEVGHVARKHAPVEDDAPGGKRVARHGRLDEAKRRDKDGGDDVQRRHGAAVRPARVGSRVEAKEERKDGGDEGDGAEKVDAAHLGEEVVGGGRRGQVEVEVDDEGGNHTERRLPDKGPPPADGVGEEAAEGRPRGGADRVDNVDVALPHAAVAQRDEVGHEDGDDGRHAAAADARDGAGQAELGHGLGEAAAQTAEAKDGIGKEEALLAAKDVAELAVEGLAAGEGEEVPGRMCE